MTHRALDLFCGAGGATRGLQRAGFHVTGIDIRPQPKYCGDLFIQADALNPPVVLSRFDFIWASPPCQAFTMAQRIRRRSHPDYVARTRRMLTEAGVPWCIENVPGAPLIRPVELCGAMFGLGVYRHRLFETSFACSQPWPCSHDAPQTKMGRRPKPGEVIQVVGHFSGVKQAQAAMGIDWMGRDELREAIPPAYSEHVAYSAIAALGVG